MGRAGPKSKKAKAGPKSKKKVEEVVEEEVFEKSEGEEEEVVEKENDVKDEDTDAADDAENQSEEDEPPAKKGRGRPPSAKGSKKKGKTPAKTSGRASSRGRKTPAAAKAKKKEESEEEEEDDGKEYEVEKILDSRRGRAGKEYLIKWKNYGKKDATWEPEDNLNCEEAMKEWEVKLEERKKTPGAYTRDVRKPTDRYVDIAGAGNEHRRRHSKRMDTKSPRKSYREEIDSD